MVFCGSPTRGPRRGPCRQAVDDVRDGRASTAARAIRQRYNREPVTYVDPPVASADQPPPIDSPSADELGVSPTIAGYVRAILGTISLDPCSAEWCAERVDAAEWYGADRDGLSQNWQGNVWVFPPPDAADPFLSKVLLEFEAGRIDAAVVLVPMTPWADGTIVAFRSPHFRAVVLPGAPVTCRRPDGSSVCPDQPLWLLLFGDLVAPPADVFGSFASTILVPEVRS